MNDLPRQPVAIAIKSYIHAPRALSVAEVIGQLASVFPGLDRTTIAHQENPEIAQNGCCCRRNGA